MSGTAWQKVHVLVWTLPIFDSLSLVGKRDCIILKMNVFCSGVRPNVLAIWYESLKLMRGCLSSNLDFISKGGVSGSSLVWVMPLSSKSWYHC